MAEASSNRHVYALVLVLSSLIATSVAAGGHGLCCIVIAVTLIRHSQDAHLAFDGDKNTAWVSGRAKMKHSLTLKLVRVKGYFFVVCGFVAGNRSFICVDAS